MSDNFTLRLKRLNKNSFHVLLEFSGLTDLEKQILEKYYLSNLNFYQLSEYFNYSECTIKNLVYKIRRKLKYLCESQYYLYPQRVRNIIDYLID